MDRQLAVFCTELGWLGLLGAGRKVARLQVGHARADEVRERLACEVLDGWTESDWWPELRQRLTAYASGAVESFRDVALVEGPRTAFAQRVVEALRRVDYGTTVSYGELARRAGAPGAARAVGSVMRGNPAPLIVPCHRVIAAGGRIGGFSAPSGIALKQRLLRMEAEGVACRWSGNGT